jgi:6-pyruvoyl-tetrahydropterin synthase
MDKKALKENIIKSLIEKRDYTAVTNLLDKDDEKANSTKMIKLMEPISAFADMLTENTQGVMMEQLEKKLEEAVAEVKAELLRDMRKEIQAAIASITRGNPPL